MPMSIWDSSWSKCSFGEWCDVFVAPFTAPSAQSSHSNVDLPSRVSQEALSFGRFFFPPLPSSTSTVSKNLSSAMRHLEAASS